MSKYAWVSATTGRFRKWFVAYHVEHRKQPTLDEILRWLKHKEDYATPIDELEYLCDELNDDAKSMYMVLWITNRLISALKEERQIVDTAKSFFNAMVEKCGIDDTEVRLYDNRTGNRVGTLHDLQLRKEETVAK